MDEQVEKFGSNRKLKRFHNKQQRTQIKNYLNAVKEAPENFKEDYSDIEEYELKLQEEEWKARGNKTEEQLVDNYHYNEG
ncbi:MAG TPA: hypothetical protein EYF95_03390 [Flavobacteriales bacterium]|jgi:DNA-binding ferritin-like protein (Dps family)|nr:hypothetical protein [Flavobacteriales bacterium]